MLKTLVLMALLALPISAQTVKQNVTAEADANDIGCGVSFVQFYLGATPIGPQIQSQTSTYTYVWDSRTVVNGTYTISAKATDKAGINGACDGTKPNSTMSTSVSFTVNNVPDDVTPPTVTMKPLLSGAVITAKQQSIQVAASDESGISRIGLKINGVVKAQNTNQNSLSMLWNTSPYKGYSNIVIEAEAADTFGNTKTQSITVAVKK